MASACSNLPTIEPDDARRQQLYNERQDSLITEESWSLKARLALNNGEDGGSGTLNWVQGRDELQLDFHGALGRGAWTLESSQGQAVLTQADGQVVTAMTVNELVRDQLGHEVPVDALAWWVRGLAAPGDREGLTLNEYGAPQRLQQAGWRIEFERYREFEGRLMPLKITARQDEWVIKLAIRAWKWPEVLSQAMF